MDDWRNEDEECLQNNQRTGSSRSENYINKDIVNYSTQRNFDFGPSKRNNVSCLSLISLID